MLPGTGATAPGPVALAADRAAGSGARQNRGMDGFDPVGFALWGVAFLFSTTCHEAAHGLAAAWGGDATALRAGQVTLNPLPHVRREPFGMLFVPALSYALAGWMIGWASAPYDPYWAARHPRRAGLMALAGPLANLALSLAAIGGLRLLVHAGIGFAPAFASFEHLLDVPSGDPLALAGARLLSILACLNALLFVFNLLPIPPLDGATVVAGFGGEAVRRAWAGLLAMPWASLIGILVSWKVFDLVAPSIFLAVLSLAHPGVAYGG